MAPQRPVTPEKQLLSLIEEHKAQGNSASIQAQALKHQHLSFMSWGAWAGRFSFFQDWLRKRTHGAKGRPFDIKIINQAAVVCIFILAGYFLFDFISSLAGLWKMPNFETVTSENVKPLSFRDNSVLKSDVASYLEKARGRDFFKISAGTGEQTDNGGATENNVLRAPSPQAVDASVNMKLVGISWSSDPDAIIEDTKATQTYFVKVGDPIGTGKVEAIFKDKVVLKYGDQEIELK